MNWHDKVSRDRTEGAARDLKRSREELGESRDELTESLVELHREPRASVEFTEAELNWVIGVLEATPVFKRPAYEDSAFNKLLRARAIESGPGGSFHRGGEVA